MMVLSLWELNINFTKKYPFVKKNCSFNCLPQLQPLDCTGTFLYDHYNYTFHIGIYQIWCKVSKVFEQIQLHILRNFFLLYCVGIDIVKYLDLLLWVGN